MKTTLLAVFLASILPWRASAAEAPKAAPKSAEFTELRGGRYALKVDGMLCTACARAIVAELTKLSPVEKASADFESGEVLVIVKKDKKVSMSSVRRALHKAAKRVNLGTKFEAVSVVYRPTL